MKCKNCRDWGLLLVRALIGILFIVAAMGKFSDIAGTAVYIGSTWLPAPVFLAWASAVLELAGGLALILGIHSNIAAMILAVFLIVVDFTFHFKLVSPLQMMMFFKDLAIIGGLLSVAFCGSGRYRLLKCKCCAECAECKTK